VTKDEIRALVDQARATNDKILPNVPPEHVREIFTLRVRLSMTERLLELMAQVVDENHQQALAARQSERERCALLVENHYFNMPRPEREDLAQRIRNLKDVT
jgi:hypothetical protein